MNCIISNSAIIEQNVGIYNDGGIIEIGDGCHLKQGCILRTYGGRITLKDRVSIGEYTIIYGHGGVTVGEATIIAPHCTISAQKHIFPANVPLRYSGETKSGITIDSGSIISSHVVVVDSVFIGKNVMIGANSLVNTDIPDSSFAAGSPIKIISSDIPNKLYGRLD
jgi:acetyltransferase-like isoleucine patch superfamily enzyme